MKDNQKIKELLEAITEELYQKDEGSCRFCGEQDYPVRGDKKGYKEVLPEDAEEYHLDHLDDCIVTKLTKAHALLKPCPTCGGSKVVATEPCLSGMDTLTEREIPCPDCTPSQEPASDTGEFVKVIREEFLVSRLREAYTNKGEVNVQDCMCAAVRIERLTILCKERSDRLEAAEKERDRLKNVLEQDASNLHQLYSDQQEQFLEMRAKLEAETKRAAEILNYLG